MTDAPTDEELDEGQEPQRVTDADLYAFGNAAGPRAPRATTDFHVNGQDDLVQAGVLPLPQGASTFSDPMVNDKPDGHYHRLPKGTALPEGLAVVRDDGAAVNDSPNPPTHHTLYPTRQMPFAEFSLKFTSLPWQYVGKKRRR